MDPTLSKGLLLFIVCCVTRSQTTNGGVYNVSDEKRLFKFLFSDYYVHIIPRENSSAPLYISVLPGILFLDGLNVKRQTYTARIFFDLAWSDKLLTWDPQEYSGVEKINVPYSMLWTPDLCIAGSVDDYIDIGKEGTIGIVYNTGHITLWPIKVFEITCVVDIEKYPFDEHSCEIDLSSWTLDDKSVQMVAGSNSISLTMLTPGGEWEVYSEPSYYNTVPYGAYNYSHVVFPFKIRRRWQFIILNRYFPTLCTSLLTLLCFCLPKESGERVGLSISIFLSLAVFMTVTSQDLPETADAVSLLGAYVAIQLAWSGMTIILTVTSLAIAYKDNDYSIPKWIQTLTILCKHGPRTYAYKEYESEHIRNDSNGECDGVPNYKKGIRMHKIPNQSASHVTWGNVSTLFNISCLYGSIACQICLNLWFLIRAIL